MKLAVSNIAWQPAETPAMYALLADAGVTGVEAAPGILFPGAPRPLRPDMADITRALEQTRPFGLSFVSMQAVHFGLENAALFGGPDQRAQFTGALTDAVDLCAALDIGNIVIGSPRNRIRPESLDPDAAFHIAAQALQPIADRAQAHGVTLSIEANPAVYGGNFVTHLAEAVRLCELAAHPAIGVNFDLGERLINAGRIDAASDLRAGGELIRHVQISAPELGPPLGLGSQVADVARHLTAQGFDGWFSIEMRRPPDNGAQILRTVIDEVTAALGQI